MATADIDALLDRLRRLSPDELARVSALVVRLAAGTGAAPSRFRAFSGVLTAEDAASMQRAVEDCERIDPSAW